MPKQDFDFRLALLRALAKDLRYLLDRGYHKGPALNFLANRWQLTSLEREILTRAIFAKEEAIRRKKKRGLIKDLKGRSLVVDGHNVLITIESALRGLPVFWGDDGFVRDASRLSRKFKKTVQTIEALKALGKALAKLPLAQVVIYFDAPLSRSGELAAQAREILKTQRFTLEVYTVPSADLCLRKAPLIATSDSALIDQASKVFDLGAYTLKGLGLKPFKL